MRDWNLERDIKRHVNLQSIWGTEKILCPWHSDTNPSLHIYPDHVHCFSAECPSPTHDGFDLIMALEGISFDQAVDYLARFRGKEPIETQTKPAYFDSKKILEYAKSRDDTLSFYLADRHIRSIRCIHELHLGWTGRAISIPHFAEGQITNVKFRIHPDFQMDNEPKYTSFKGHPFTHLYPWDYFRRHFYLSRKVLFLTEGEFDAILLLQEHIPALSFPSGVPKSMDPWHSFLNEWDEVILLLDQDKAGRAAAHRLAPQRYNTVSWAWDPAHGKDVSEAAPYIIKRIKNYKNYWRSTY